VNCGIERRPPTLGNGLDRIGDQAVIRRQILGFGWRVTPRRQVDRQVPPLRCRVRLGDQVAVPFQLLCVLGRIDLVLDQDHELVGWIDEQEVDVLPLAANGQMAEIPGIEEDRAEHGSDTPGPNDDCLQEPSREGITETMVLAGIEQEGQEIGVANLLPHDLERLEDVELLEHPLERFQIRVVDDERFERLKSLALPLECINRYRFRATPESRSQPTSSWRPTLLRLRIPILLAR
jgi:hypothetical protein